MNIDFAFKALQKLVIFRYGGFGFTVSDKWLHKTEEEEETKKTSRQQPFKKWRVGISKKAAHTVRCCFWRKCSAVFDQNDFWADVNKIKASECHGVPVLQWVCMNNTMIENVSSLTLLTKWITEKVLWHFFVLVDWWHIDLQKIQSNIWKYRLRLFGILTEVFWGRQVCSYPKILGVFFIDLGGIWYTLQTCWCDKPDTHFISSI